MAISFLPDFDSSLSESFLVFTPEGNEAPAAPFQPFKGTAVSRGWLCTIVKAHCISAEVQRFDLSQVVHDGGQIEDR